jgi:signal peptidase I
MRRTNWWRKVLKEHVAPVAITVLVLCSFRSAVADWNVVPTGSMNPTIIEGDLIFVNKLAYGLRVPFTNWRVAQWDGPARGDVIVFQSPVDGTRLVKRVVGLPGDTIAMENNRLSINGQAVAYSSVIVGGKNVVASEQLGGHAHAVMATPAIPARRSFGSIIVPADQYFVLGDNRDDSADSRYIGFVPRGNIWGRSSKVLMSFDPQTHLPRVSRTLHALP